VVVLLAVRSLRRALSESPVRQAEQMRKLVEAVNQLHRQQQHAELRLQMLTDANRRLAADLAALGERIGDGQPLADAPPRLLH